MNKYQKREYVEHRVGLDAETGQPRMLSKQRDGTWTEMVDDGVTLQRDISYVYLKNDKNFHEARSSDAYDYYRELERTIAQMKNG